MEHGLKQILLYVQKHIVAMAMCYNPVQVRDKPLWAPASVKQVYWTYQNVSEITILTQIVHSFGQF